jgi:hypothetical protein
LIAGRARRYTRRVALPPQKPPQKSAFAPKPPPEDALAKAKREKDELEGECRFLEEELEELKARYEQYFLGVERKEPVRRREELRKRVLRVKDAFTRNTGLRFRLQSLHARYLSYERLWLRGAREKEEGTYRRDLFKARLRAHKDGLGPTPAEKPAAAKAAPAEAPAQKPAAGGPTAPPPTVAAAPARAEQQRPGPTAPGSVPAPSARPAPPAGGMKDAELRALYDAYVAAKKRCNEDVSRLTYDAVAKSVSKQIPEIMTRYKAKTVEFKVEVKDGKAVLKAIPKV